MVGTGRKLFQAGKNTIFGRVRDPQTGRKLFKTGKNTILGRVISLRFAHLE